MLKRVESVEDSSDSYARFEMTAICKRIGRGGRKAGGVDASGSGGVLARIDTQFPHERLRVAGEMANFEWPTIRPAGRGLDVLLHL